MPNPKGKNQYGDPPVASLTLARHGLTHAEQARMGRKRALADALDYRQARQAELNNARVGLGLSFARLAILAGYRSASGVRQALTILNSSHASDQLLDAVQDALQDELRQQQRRADRAEA